MSSKSPAVESQRDKHFDWPYYPKQPVFIYEKSCAIESVGGVALNASHVYVG